MNIKGFKTKDGSSVVQTGDMVDARIGNSGVIYHIEFDQENSTITHDGEEINWLEFAQKVEAGVPIVLTGTVTPPGDVGHNVQFADYILVDAVEGVLIFPVMFWSLGGETANLSQVIVNYTEHWASYSIGSVGYTHMYPPMD